MVRPTNECLNWAPKIVRMSALVGSVKNIELQLKKSFFISIWVFSSLGTSSMLYSIVCWLPSSSSGRAENLRIWLRHFPSLKPPMRRISLELSWGTTPISTASVGNFVSIYSNLSPVLTMFNFRFNLSIEADADCPPNTYKKSPRMQPEALALGIVRSGRVCQTSALKLYFSVIFDGFPSLSRPPNAKA